MNSRTQERVEQWDSQSFTGGYDGLSELATTDFSGAVTAAGTWLFMLNGRIVGVFEGEIEDFENASGTQYDAPHPSLPLLCAMQERDGETRANYYTNETPLREVDATLQEGSFTGYIELSENVLSGDYYAVYYGGRRMAAAYIGNAGRLITDEEAFERADDEVGIYEVTDVDVEVTDVPGTATGATSSTESASSASGAAPGESSSSATDAASDTTSLDSDAADDTDASIEATDTSPSIESIEFAGIDESADATAGEDSAVPRPSEVDLTADPTSITTSEESESEPVATGITEAGQRPSSRDGSDDETLTEDASTAADSADEPVAELPIEESDPAADEIDTPEAALDAVSKQSVRSETDPADVEAESVAGTESESVAGTEAESIASDSVDSATESTAETASSEAASDATDGSTAPPGDGEPSASPDLAELEAAAEELDRNDISWVEDEPAETTPEESAVDTDGDDTQEERFEEEAQWREARSIPSIDPDNSETSTDGSTETHSASSVADSGTTGSSRTASSQEAASAPQDGRSQDAVSRRSQRQSQEVDRIRAKARDRIQELTDRLETLTEQRDALREHAEEVETERDELRSRNQELASTVERLQSRIEELETELDRARNAATAGESESGAATSGTELQPKRALSETNLFVRYGSKSQPTLKTAHAGDAGRSEVAENLRLEHHTQFDASDVVVDGMGYEKFLEATMAYRFVDWLTEVLLYEIRDTGNADGLGDLYDAIPLIDRAELNATISLEDDETEDVPDQVTFDVVAYDKMGNPLLLANLNDARSPATEEMLVEMEEAASAVKANYPDLAAATVVTSSYFEPGALEVTEEATSSGLLSRGSKLSYVNLSRKTGYHLCLVESRSEGFHMNVPEL